MTALKQGLCTWKKISTHILTRRMTAILASSEVGTLFQLTSSRGGWLRYPLSFLRRKYFNSHPHEEDDEFKDGRNTGRGFISTHILTRRMTTHWTARRCSQVFQLTSSRGGWHCPTLLNVWCWVFQLTSSRGGWRLSLLFMLSYNYFNSHPHEEDDSNFKQK